MTEATATDGYGGLFGAFPFALRRSRSLVFKLYVVVGAVMALVVALLFFLGLIRIFADTGGSATLAFARTFVVVVGLLVVIPIVTPILLVARRHRRGIGDDVRYDRRLALSGFLFLGALYVGLIPTVPPEHRTEVGGSLAPVVETLYGLPWTVGFAIVIAGALAVYLAHRLSR